MSWLAVAVIGGAAVSGGMSVMAGQAQMSAAKSASAAISDASMRAETGLNNRYQQAMGFLQPYQQYGLLAGSTLSRMFVSPQEQALQRSQEHERMQSQLDVLKPYTVEWGTANQGMWHLTPILSGKDASRRREQMGREQISQKRQEYDQLKGQLTAFDKQTELIKNAPQQNVADILQESPAYKYAVQLTDRALAARGMANSGEAIKQHGGLAAQLVGQQTQGLFGLYGTGAQAAGQLAGGAMSTGQQVAQAQMFGGQGQAQGYMAQGQAQANMYSGIASAIGGATNAGISMYNTQTLANSLSRANTSGLSGPGPEMTQTGAGTGYSTGGQSFNVNLPR